MSKYTPTPVVWWVEKYDSRKSKKKKKTVSNDRKERGIYQVIYSLLNVIILELHFLKVDKSTSKHFQ